jgi:hypothetical protein
VTRTDPTDFEREIVANVREHGCHINYIFDPNEDTPAFAYSVGFPETIDQPEIIVFGLPMDMMKFIINETMRKCREGLRLEDGLEIPGLLAGHVCMALEIPCANITREYFNSAMWFRRHVAGEEMDAAFQIVWPGAQDGLFPWDDGCSEIVRWSQPPLATENGLS